MFHEVVTVVRLANCACPLGFRTVLMFALHMA